MIRPEQEVKQRVKAVFDMRVISEMSRRSGIPHETLRSWRDNPLKIKAVDLLRLEQMTCSRKIEMYRGKEKR